MKVAALLFAVTLLACSGENSPRIGCRRRCQSKNDQCLVDATDGTGIQLCDNQSKRCMAGCP